MADQFANSSLSEKLPDSALRQIIEQGTGEPVSVIVELNLPPQRVALENNNLSRGAHAYAVRKVVEETSDQQRENALKIRQTRKFLKSLLGKDPHWLDSARAFVVQATPEQLREMADFPLTRTIRPNRHLGGI